MHFPVRLGKRLALPIGTQDAGLLDTRINDEDTDKANFIDDISMDENAEEMVEPAVDTNHLVGLRNEAEFKQRAAEIYKLTRQPTTRGSSG